MKHSILTFVMGKAEQCAQTERQNAAARWSACAMTIVAILAAGLITAAHASGGEGELILKNVTEAPEDKTLVVGSIRYRKQRVDSTCGEFLEQCHIIVVPPQGGKPLVYPFKLGGFVTWALPAGDYIVAGLDRGRNGKSFSYVLRVPEGKGAIYVGELTFDVSDEGIRVWLDDNFDQASGRFDASFPDRTGTLVRKLIGSYGNPGDWEEALTICSGHWGESCNRARQGLVPILPTKSRGPSFAITETRPRFEWTPSKRPGLTYDFALFDAVLYHGMPYRGRMIVYQQAIDQPFWQLDRSLDPGRSYLWSVRLRIGGVISTWSTHTASYSTGFLGMNATAAYGEWFRFDVPASAKSQ